jgi:hypothetical protein
MKKLFITTTMCLAALMASAQCRENSAYEVKAENAYTNYNVRYASNPQDAKHYTTDRLRKADNVAKYLFHFLLLLFLLFLVDHSILRLVVCIKTYNNR